MTVFTILQGQLDWYVKYSIPLVVQLGKIKKQESDCDITLIYIPTY